LSLLNINNRREYSKRGIKDEGKKSTGDDKYPFSSGMEVKDQKQVFDFGWLQRGGG